MNHTPILPEEERLLRNYYLMLSSSNNVTQWTESAESERELDQEIGNDVFSFLKKLDAEKEKKANEFIDVIRQFRLGKVPLGGDWEEHAGKGLIFKTTDTGITHTYSTPEQDKNTHNIFLLGIDYSGTKYASRYYAQLRDAGILHPEAEVITHSLEANAEERSFNHVFAYLQGDTETTSPDAINIVKKYIIPKLIDEQGNYRNDLLTGDNAYKINFIAHSHGCALSHIVENALREALYIDPQKYGLKEKIPAEIAAQIMKRTQIIAIGLTTSKSKPSKHWPDAKNIPHCSALHIVAKDDILTPRTKSHIGAEFLTSHNFDTRQKARYSQKMGVSNIFNAFSDEYSPDTILYLLDTGYTKPATKNIIDVLGHSFGCYLEGINRPDGEKYRNTQSTTELGDFIRNALISPIDFQQAAKHRLHVKPSKIEILEEIVDNNPKFFPFYDNHRPSNEVAHWNTNKKHPFWPEFTGFKIT